MQGAEESDESVITLEHEIGLLDNEVPAIPDPYNLQDDSEDYADITEVLTRSRNEWLTGVDVHNFFTFHEDPTISHVPVDLYGEGLYLYEEGEATDTVADWIPFSDGNVQRLKNSHGVHPLICLCSRLLLDPIDVGIRSTYERRVYRLQGNIRFAAYTFVHYRRRFIADDEESSDGRTSDEAENSGDENSDEVPAILDPYNLQDDSEDYADITEVLTRSRNEWLTGVDVHNFFTFHEDPTISHVPVDLYGEGLYLYEKGEATDTIADWLPFPDGNVQRLKNSHGEHPLLCLCSRLLLDPIDVGIRSTYERRVYILQENIQYAAYTFVHYRRRFIADDEEASDGGTSDEAENSGDDGNDVAGSYSDDHDNNAPGPAPTSAYAPTSASDPAKTERKMNTSSLILHVGNAYRGKKVSEICCDSLKDFNQMVHVFTEKDYLSTVGTDLSEKFDVVTGYGSPTTREERSVSLRPIPWTILKLYFAMREFPVFEESEGRRHGECSLLDLATDLEIDKNFYEANEIESLMDGLASEMQSLQLIVLSPASSSDSDSQPKLEAVILPHSSGTSGHLTSKKGMPCQITELSTSRRPRYMTERKVILVIDENHSAKVCVSVDKPIPDGVELGDLCEKGHGFFCNATELWLKSLVSEDLDKFLDNTLLEAVYADTRTCLLYLNDAENLIGENVTAISLQTSYDNLQAKVLEGIEAMCVKDLTLQSDCSKKIDGWTHSDNPRRNNDGDLDTRLCARK